MSKVTKRVLFYNLVLKRESDTRSNREDIYLNREEIEEKFRFICDEKAICLKNGKKAINVSSSSGDYVLEIVNYENKRAFIKIGQQNPSNTVALRDRTTLETEAVPMRETQLLELFTFCLIDFETCVLSYIGINGAPRISAIKNFFDKHLVKEEIYTSIATIMTDDILNTLINKNIISKISLTVAIPEDKILSDIGVPENTFDSLMNVKTLTETYNIVAMRNRNIFKSSSILGEWMAVLKEKYGNRLTKMSATAKDKNEYAQTYDLLSYNFTKKVVLCEGENKKPNLEDYHKALEVTYDTYRSEIIRYIRM